MSFNEFFNTRTDFFAQRKNRVLVRYFDSQDTQEPDLSELENYELNSFLNLFNSNESDTVLYHDVKHKYFRLLDVCYELLSIDSKSVAQNLAYSILQVASNFSNSVEKKLKKFDYLNNSIINENLIKEALDLGLCLVSFYCFRKELCGVFGDFVVHSESYKLPNLSLNLNDLPELKKIYDVTACDTLPHTSSDVFIDYSWIKKQCERWISSNTQVRSTSINDLVLSVFQLLTSLEPEQLVVKLHSLLGDNSMNLIEKLIQNQSKLLRNVLNDIKSPVVSNSHYNFGDFAIINKKLQREDQKDTSRRKKLLKLLNVIEKNYKTNQNQPNTVNIRQRKRPNLSVSNSSKNIEINTQSNELFSSFNCARKSNSVYDSIQIPAITQISENVELLSVNDCFEPFFQQVFKGVTHLNLIQSIIYPIAFKTNLNMLVCAPTGAGKTNVALMAILREIDCYRDKLNDNILMDEFKIIYIAPMKALASEITRNYSSRLSPLNIKVREFTGDIKLSKKQIKDTQVIITTPEKWDVITRKNSEIPLLSLVNLLIIDEIHLLYEERGATLEVLVARTLRQIEQIQKSIRIIGLSATITNYEDVAEFLRVNSNKGLFNFDSKYRPVPLTQELIGVKTKNSSELSEKANYVCFQKVKESLEQNEQVMVFVNSRNETVLLAEKIIKYLNKENCSHLVGNQSRDYRISKKLESRNHRLNKFINKGFGFHNAGMNREDRRLVESLFFKGVVRCLVSTATLAWGVNLPAHRVIINGTEVYNYEKGKFDDLQMIDVLQIFGRAGRPGLDTSGEAILITSQKKLNYYFRLLSEKTPIESQFQSKLVDNLNAEIVLGTVSNIYEAVQWLSYTYMWVRLPKNPLVYGYKESDLILDSQLVNYRSSLIEKAAENLQVCKMVRFDSKSCNFFPTDLGRIASHYYISSETIKLFNDFFDERTVNASDKNNTFQSKVATISDADILNLISRSVEFKNIRLRNSETDVFNKLANVCKFKLPTYTSKSIDHHDKVSILLQCHISRRPMQEFNLESDMYYITQNVGRIFRALFEIAYKQGFSWMAQKCLDYTKMVEYQVWDTDHFLAQLNSFNFELLNRMQKLNFNLYQIREISPEELVQVIHGSYQQAQEIVNAAWSFPIINLEATIKPLSVNVLKINLTLKIDFQWNDEYNDTAEPWWIWIQDPNSLKIYDSYYFLLDKKSRFEPQYLTFIVPRNSKSVIEYQISCFSDRWIGADTIEFLQMDSSLLPNDFARYTPLLNLTPLPKRALNDLSFEALYNFTHFNPLQTQTFFTLFHTDNNVLIGSPTGSGKTIVAELAMLKLFRDTPNLKVIYVAPLKALVRERLNEWNKFSTTLNKKVVELTGDYTPDTDALTKSEIIITTPEKWDGISRNWKKRNYVQKVGLIIFDEIHLLGEDRGPILEVIISRMLYISNFIKVPIRLVGLSTAISNINDLADWMNVDRIQGLFNFHPSVRPIPIEFHISSVSEKHYCPRMAMMNKPVSRAIEVYSNKKPVLIFVSSRRQTRLTSIDLIKYNENPRKFLNISSEEIEKTLNKLEDQALVESLRYGIGLHHAGLSESDKKIVEELFLLNKIQILVSTATLAWGVNLPAHLVIVKGTEYYDAKTKKYIDYPITDLLQMVGRAGRPQFDSAGCSVIFVEESKKNFYKKFIYEPFPIESKLLDVLHDHINAEVVTGLIKYKKDAIEYLIWTFMFRRMLKNPVYYGLEKTDSETINEFLSSLVEKVFDDLSEAHCLVYEKNKSLNLSKWEVKPRLSPSAYGKIASYYYLNYKTIKNFYENLKPEITIKDAIDIMCSACEYDEIPVRHNEDIINDNFSRNVRYTPSGSCENPMFKASLLYQAYLSKLELPISDYVTDTKFVIDQNVRIIQAMAEVCAERGWLNSVIVCIYLLQMTVRAQWIDEPSYLTLPGFRDVQVQNYLNQSNIFHLAQILNFESKKLDQVLNDLSMNVESIRDLNNIKEKISRFPIIEFTYSITIQDPEKDILVINIVFKRLNKASEHGAYCPNFVKKKDEGWWFIVGNESANKLLALKKLSCSTRPVINVSLTFVSKNLPFQPILYIISDTYIGLDLQENLVLPTV